MNFTKFALIVAVFAVGLMVVGCNGDPVKEKDTLEKVVNGLKDKAYDTIKADIKDEIKIIVFDGTAFKLYKDEAAAKVDFADLDKMTKVETKEGKFVYSPKKEADPEPTDPEPTDPEPTE